MNKTESKFTKSIFNNRSTDSQWNILANYFENEGKPLGEVDLSVEVFGIFALPEDWIRKETTGIWDGWTHKLEVSELIFDEGIFNQKEMTEEEKKKIEDEKNAKKKPPPGKNKPEEPSKEEVERLEKLRIQQEEIRKKKEEEWNSLDEETKFYRKSENKYESQWISIPQGKNIKTITKKGSELIEIEDDINYNYGLLLEYTRTPPEEDPKKKKALPKNVSPDDLKQLQTVGWLDLKDFLKGGCKECYKRVRLQTRENYEKFFALDEASATENKIDKDYIQNTGTYVYLKINFSNPINPNLPDKPLPNPNDIARREEKPFQKITDIEICGDFRKQLKIAIEAIAKEYVNFMGESAKTQLIRKDKLSGNMKKEERTVIINRFLVEFNVTGKAEILKEKLKRYIIRIVKDVHKKQEVKGIFKNENDQYYSELYAYLTEEVKIGMDEYIKLKKDELHEDIVSSSEQRKKEVFTYASRVTNETEERKLLRLSKEYEIMEKYKKSLEYFSRRLLIVSTKESLIQYTILSKKNDNLNDVEETLNDCITYDSDDLNLKILYSGIKYLRNKLAEAILFMETVIKSSPLGIKSTDTNFNILLAFFYKEKGEELLYIKHIERAIKFKFNELNGEKKIFRQNKQKIELSNEVRDELFYDLIHFLNEFDFYKISEKLLNEIIDKSNIKYLLELARISLLFKKDYRESIDLSNQVLTKQKGNYDALILLGNACYKNNLFYEAEEAYLKAIRKKPKIYDEKTLYRLGKIYVKRKSWNDAIVVFSKLVKDNYSFACRYLGLAYMNVGQNDLAEESLNQANLLDVENINTWGYLTVFCLKNGKLNQAFECVREIMKPEFKKIETLREIADMFYKANEYLITIEIFKKILSINPNLIDIKIYLSEIYIIKLDRKQSGIELLQSINNCDDETLRAKINKLFDYVNSQNEGLMSKDEEISIVGSHIESNDQNNFFEQTHNMENI